MISTKVRQPSRGSSDRRSWYQYPPLDRVAGQGHTIEASDLALESKLGLDNRFVVFISIPFCRVKCHSCHFFKELLPSQTDETAFLDQYVECLATEIDRFGATRRFSSGVCSAVYFGGGTASLLNADNVENLIEKMQASFTFSKAAEITLEGNPREFTAAYLSTIREAGVNRVSLGYQSRSSRILRDSLNSPHTGQQAVDAARAALSAGFATVNLDMLYAIPGQTFSDWKTDVRAAIRMSPESLTIFRYLVHPGSASDRLVTLGRLPQGVDDETAFRWWTWARRRFIASGYVPQRRSGFAKPGHEQAYGRLSYTEGVETIGLGAGAYSWIHRYQFRAPSASTQYCEQVRAGRFPVIGESSERATDRALMERFVIFRFSGNELILADFRSMFGRDATDVFSRELARLEGRSLVRVEDERIALTETGRRYRNQVRLEFSDERHV